MNRSYFLFIAVLALNVATAQDMPSDKHATKETVNLYKNLKRLINKGIMFGHQDALAYGVGWRNEKGRSDVKDVVGDYPAVYGWELGNIEHGLNADLNSVPFDDIRNYIREAYDRGGVATFSWHGDNPLTGGSAWDTTHGTVRSVLPGGEKHSLYVSWLDKIGTYLSTIRTNEGKPVPLLFRPFHELTGNWFWWCRNNCTPDEFKKMFRFTIDYLRNEKNLHNLLIVYNTSDFHSKEEFLSRYPGDDVVDLVSFDTYQYGNRSDLFAQNLSRTISLLEEIAKEKNKIPALAEIGYEAIPDAKWWTNSLWKAMEGHELSYVMAWRNHGQFDNGKWHYYAPFKGQISANDFIDFYKLDRTLFEKDAAREKIYADPGAAIMVDQVGYYSKEKKLAVLTGSHPATKFYIVSANTKDTVFKGDIGEERKSLYSSTLTRLIDFSSFNKPGKYLISVPGVGESYPFLLGDAVYHAAAKAVLKGFYFMRSDIPLEEKFAGKWKRPAGHPDTKVLIHPSAASADRPAGTVVSSPGGWYDAGDYNKYIVNSGITMGTLLSAYEDFPAYFKKLNTGIPESKDNIPDLLNEVIYNLRWMLTMQDPSDGGVYHKCTNANFDGMVMPGVTKDPRYVVQKSTGAALDFATVTAQGARIFSEFASLGKLADSCIVASRKAWKWARQNPSVFYSQNSINKNFDPDITTGEYGDRSFADEWLWAASELSATTKEEEFYLVVEKHMKDPASLQSWGNVAMMGYYTLVRNERRLLIEPKLIQAMKDTIVKMADALLRHLPENVFGSAMPLTVRDFVWGSNAVAANQGMLLISAYKITNDKKYVEAALSNIHYLLGRNATGYSFITGIGSKSPMHPHHRPSEADGIVDPVPGLLAGGPNPGMQDKCNYLFTEPETAYVDVTCSYASNEIAINWNAPAVYLLNAIEAIFSSRLPGKP